MAGTRICEQCGALFTPRREHARFCTTRCRAAWNRQNKDSLAAETTALTWSLAAMCDTVRALPHVPAGDLPRAFALIGEAVWWVTIVDATLVRHHADEYDRALSRLTRQQCQRVEGTLAGLRFVRNLMSRDVEQADLICPGASQPGRGPAPVTAWTWKPVSEPAPAALPSASHAWEISRHRAYQSQLAGHAIGETFQQTADFLAPAVRTAGPPITARP